MRIVFVVLHFGSQAMEVVVEQVGPTGPKRRIVTVGWQSKDTVDMPPDDWVRMVQAEMDFQDSNRMPGIG